MDAAFAPNAKDLISVEAAPILSWLESILLAAKYAALKNAQDADGRLAISAFGANGFGLEFEPTELSIGLTIPAEMRRGVELRLGTGEPYHGNPLPPEPTAKFSSYANFLVVS